MDQETGREGEEQIEASGDSIVIAGGLHAIAEGLQGIAEAINRLAAAQSLDEGDPQIQSRYLDGSSI